MQNGIANNALMDRGDGGACMPRIPTGRYPAFSTTLRATLDANGNADVEFEAERDMLFIGLSIEGPDATLEQMGVNLTYCNTKYLVNVVAKTFRVCCDRKPVFLVGVREDKRLAFELRGGVAADEVGITLHGFQGNGCCG